MTEHLHIYVHLISEPPDSKLSHQQILTELRTIGDTLSAELDRLKASVQAETDATTSAVTLLGNLSAIIKQNLNDPAALSALADDIDKDKQALATAVAANTPAAPTATVPPVGAGAGAGAGATVPGAGGPAPTPPPTPVPPATGAPTGTAIPPGAAAGA